MWSTILGVVFGLIGKIFGIGKSQAEIGLEKGEQLGQAEEKAKQDDETLKALAADASADRTIDSVPDSELRSRPEGFFRDKGGNGSA